MSLFRKIFGRKTDDPNQKVDDDGRSKYMPEIELPIDERFTIQFKANGGKFLYCIDQSEINENFKNILTNSVLMTYSDALYYFGKWYLQLWAESLGKENKGITSSIYPC